MLYPKEDRINSMLMFACRTCKFAEPAASSCVFRNILNNVQAETAGVTQDVASDPTVGLSDFCICTLCGEELVCSTCGVEACSGFMAAMEPSEAYDEDVDQEWDEVSDDVSDDESDDASEDAIDQKEETTPMTMTMTLAGEGVQCS